MKVGGKLCIPVGDPNNDQRINIIQRVDQNNFTQSLSIGVCYVPLTAKEQQCPQLYASNQTQQYMQ